jgi:proline racemase
MFGTSVKSLQVIDAHCGGEPARIVVSGLPNIPGSTLYDKRAYMMDHLDHYRKMLIQEPRGYPCQNVDYILPACDPSAAFGFVVGEQAKVYPLMSGHNTICVATVLLETGMVPMVEPVSSFILEAPGGLVKIEAKCANGKALEIKLFNVPAFSHCTDITVKDVPELGDVACSVAYGGMHYCIVQATSIGLSLTPENGKNIVKFGEMIKTACREQFPVNHPEFDYPGCDILVFRSNETTQPGAHGKNAVVMSNGELDWNKPETWTGMIDRSPCGSGTSAVMADMWAHGELKLNQTFVHESIVGSLFTGMLVEEVEIEGKDGAANIKCVKPTIAGRAWITQYCQVVVDPSDPFQEGFTVGDIWA